MSFGTTIRRAERIGQLIKRMTGVVQGYMWGSPTMIPDLLGVQATGEPQAELWLGAHPMVPSLVGDKRLDELLAADPEGIVGAEPVATFGPRLPYLIKIIAVERPLSLQAHPSRAQAEAGFAREEQEGIPADAPNRTYRDNWPKPEVLVALQPTEALWGFRDPAKTYDLFRQLGVQAVIDIVEPLRDDDRSAPDRLAEVFARLLRLAGPGRHLVQQVADAAASAQTGGPLGLFATTARELASYFPDDPGVLAALLMNRLTLHRYDAIFLAAGNLHAYLSGGGVEIMANSDNVMRGGLTPKFVNVDELLKVLDFTPSVPELLGPVEQAPGVWYYPAPAPEFALWRVEVERASAELPRTDVGRILLVTDGSVMIKAGADSLELRRGESALITAGEYAELTGSGTAFIGSPGVS
jgi:mannose-6-phosphate isomerase